MKQFLIRLGYFLLIPLLYITFNMIINRIIIYNSDLELENARVLIIGDSHLQTSLNPDIFDSAINISQGGDPYVLTYWKLKKIMQSNDFDTIFIGLGTQNITKINDKKFNLAKYSGEMFERSYSIEHFEHINNEITIDYYKFYKILLRQTGFYPKLNHYSNIMGNFLDKKVSDVSNIDKRIENHYFIDGKLSGISNLSIQYLDSITQLTKSKNSTLILIASPVHSTYYNKIPQNILNEFDKIKMKYSSEHIIIDALQVSYPDSLFLDADHINYFGANKFTENILKQLKNHQL